MTGTASDTRFEHARHLLLRRTSGSLVEAIALFEQAAREGSGASVAQLAVFSAAGVHQRPDWDRSVDLVQRAAQLGYAPALDDLRVLSCNGDRAATADINAGPAALRAGVDIREFVRPRMAVLERSAPRMRVVRGLLTPLECQWLMARARPMLGRAEVYEVASGSSVVDARSNGQAAFDLPALEVILVLLRARLANSIGAPLACLETASVLHYAVGQQFAPHFDFLDPTIPGQAVDIQRRGQRLATTLVYLNDGYDGGETDFLRLGWRFRGAPGDALVFDNVGPGRILDPETYHAGLAPTRGDKWLLSQWVRDRPQG